MMSEQESRDILGVSSDATRDDIIAARRRLARVAHPDSGGSHLRMAAINEACRILLSARARNSGRESSQRSAERSDSSAPRSAARSRIPSGQHSRIGFRDAPSFVMNALPVDSFETLLVAAANLGEVVDEDPPYLLEVLVRDPGPVWCRFELFPDAGSTTVVLSCDVEAGYRVYSPEEIRDLWISTINA